MQKHITDSSTIVRIRTGFLAAITAGVLVCAASAEAQVSLAWSRQFGTTAQDNGTSVAVDSAGNVYVTGFTNGSLGGINAGFADAFLSRYNASGTLEWTRQIGSSALDVGNSVAVDAAGNAYITGYTSGSILGGTNAGSDDAFVTRYNTDGTVAWSRQIGTSTVDRSFGVAVAAGNVYISGFTRGSLLGQTNSGSDDAFVTRYDTDGNLAWSRQIGTSTADDSRGVAVDAAGNVYISGSTLGSLGVTNPSPGNADAFLTRFDADGTLAWSRQIGTTASDFSHNLAVDAAGNSYITGATRGSLGGPNAGQDDAFLARYNADGSLAWTRQIGSNSFDAGNGVAVDADGNAYITGFIRSDLGREDVLLSRYNFDGTLAWTQSISTGAAIDERGMGVAVDAARNVYITGWTGGNILGGTSAGGIDGFLMKYSQVPEPSSLVMLATGAGLMGLWRSRTRSGR
ncbi:MAG: SBBP repeat-containing protein [Planctomycetaceae bacterium]|nr:SBBP repeat-containing protein [Planctomycetaceae bacterium]